MTKKQRTILFICGALFIGYYLIRAISVYIAQARVAYLREQTRRQQKAKPAPVAAETPAAAAEPPLPNITGIWEGQGQLKGRGFCNLRVELARMAPDRYAGNSRFSCTDMAAVMGGKPANVAQLLEHSNPDAAMMTGAPEKGSIRFHIDKTIGTDANGCTVSDFTVTPFGVNTVAAEWQEGTCQGGNLLLRKEPMQ